MTPEEAPSSADAVQPVTGDDEPATWEVTTIRWLSTFEPTDFDDLERVLNRLFGTAFVASKFGEWIPYFAAFPGLEIDDENSVELALLWTLGDFRRGIKTTDGPEFILQWLRSAQRRYGPPARTLVSIRVAGAEDWEYLTLGRFSETFSDHEVKWGISARIIRHDKDQFLLKMPADSAARFARNWVRDLVEMLTPELSRGLEPADVDGLSEATERLVQLASGQDDAGPDPEEPTPAS